MPYGKGRIHTFRELEAASRRLAEAAEELKERARKLDEEIKKLKRANTSTTDTEPTEAAS